MIELIKVDKLFSVMSKCVFLKYKYFLKFLL